MEHTRAKAEAGIFGLLAVEFPSAHLFSFSFKFVFFPVFLFNLNEKKSFISRAEACREATSSSSASLDTCRVARDAICRTMSATGVRCITSDKPDRRKIAVIPRVPTCLGRCPQEPGLNSQQVAGWSLATANG